MPEAGSVADRVAWVRMFEQSRDASAVCAHHAISRTTLRKWWLRYQAGGVPALEDASRAPRSSPGRKVFGAEAARILSLRAAGLPLAQIRAALLADGLDISVPTIRKVLARGGTPAAQTPRPPAPSGPGLFGATLPEDPVFRSLAAHIVQGQFRPGTRLTEDRLCREYRLGRARVRDALRALALVGLVSIERNRGAVVAAPSGQAVADAYAARRLVEAGVVRQLAELPDPAQVSAHVAALRQHLRRQSEAERRGDKVSLVRLLTEFHLLLASLAGNPFLRGFIETLATTTSLAVLLYDQSPTPSCAVAEHRQIVQLIEAGDGAGAAALMAAHLGHNQGRQAQPDVAPDRAPDVADQERTSSARVAGA